MAALAQTEAAPELAAGAAWAAPLLHDRVLAAAADDGNAFIPLLLGSKSIN